MNYPKGHNPIPVVPHLPRERGARARVIFVCVCAVGRRLFFPTTPQHYTIYNPSHSPPPSPFDRGPPGVSHFGQIHNKISHTRGS